MPFTQSDLDALDTARKHGAKRIRFQDRDFEFDSVDDYIKLRNLILNDIAQQNGPQQIRQGPVNDAEVVKLLEESSKRSAASVPP